MQRHTRAILGYGPTISSAWIQLKERSEWETCGACLEIGKYLRRVGVDMTTLYRNLDRTYTKGSDDTAKATRADNVVRTKRILARGQDILCNEGWDPKGSAGR